eukprot:6175039-Pleurochrysis_carterae.AAC.4
MPDAACELTEQASATAVHLNIADAQCVEQAPRRSRVSSPELRRIPEAGTWSDRVHSDQTISSGDGGSPENSPVLSACGDVRRWSRGACAPGFGRLSYDDGSTNCITPENSSHPLLSSTGNVSAKELAALAARKRSRWLHSLPVSVRLLLGLSLAQLVLGTACGASLIERASLESDSSVAAVLQQCGVVLVSGACWACFSAVLAFYCEATQLQIGAATLSALLTLVACLTVRHLCRLQPVSSTVRRIERAVSTSQMPWTAQTGARACACARR